jgi:hypothetical protein
MHKNLGNHNYYQNVSIIAEDMRGSAVEERLDAAVLSDFAETFYEHYPLNPVRVQKDVESLLPSICLLSCMIIKRSELENNC